MKNIWGDSYVYQKPSEFAWAIFKVKFKYHFSPDGPIDSHFPCQNQLFAPVYSHEAIATHLSKLSSMYLCIYFSIH